MYNKKIYACTKQQQAVAIIRCLQAVKLLNKPILDVQSVYRSHHRF